ncbi:MAG: hypothetical protein KKC46_16530 [Proteobacteria bacterium]|nr:hypothetical protein [Pseudomonadota bacterium]
MKFIHGGKIKIDKIDSYKIALLIKRNQAVTMLRLGRILNFMKSLIDSGYEIPEPAPFTEEEIQDSNRTDTGIKLLKWFFFDTKIRGVNKEGSIYEHSICDKTAGLFVEKIRKVDLKGC